MSAHSPPTMIDLAAKPVIDKAPSRAGAEETFALSLETVYREHVGFVWRSLRHLGVAESDAEDALQDVFLVVHARLASFEERSKLSTWLYGICLRVAHARRRRAHVRREVATDPRDMVVDGVAPDASAAFERREAEELLEGVLDTMPIDQRAVFTLFEIDGVQCEQIAELVDAPIGTVYSRLRLAREAFRRATARLEVRDRFTSNRPPTGGRT